MLTCSLNTFTENKVTETNRHVFFVNFVIFFSLHVEQYNVKVQKNRARHLKMHIKNGKLEPVCLPFLHWHAKGFSSKHIALKVDVL